MKVNIDAMKSGPLIICLNKKLSQQDAEEAHKIPRRQGTHIFRQSAYSWQLGRRP
jgi:hypothetical protein